MKLYWNHEKMCAETEDGTPLCWNGQVVRTAGIARGDRQTIESFARYWRHEITDRPRTPSLADAVKVLQVYFAVRQQSATKAIVYTDQGYVMLTPSLGQIILSPMPGCETSDQAMIRVKWALRAAGIEAL